MRRDYEMPRIRPWMGAAGALCVAIGALGVVVGCGGERPRPTEGGAEPTEDEAALADDERQGGEGDDRPAEPGGPEAAEEDTTVHDERRAKMVDKQIAARGVRDDRVLAAMRSVPRHRFVPEAIVDRAYDDRPLPIGHRQTISQPYIVALMSELAEVQPDARVLDVGTGSGYQAAILAELAEQVWSIEIVCDLAERAEALLVDELGYDNVTIRCGDGYAGWAEHAPFDVIIVAAAPAEIPEPLEAQLAVGGRLVIPVGERRQELIVREKRADGTIFERRAGGVRFVPMTGRAAEEDAE